MSAWVHDERVLAVMRAYVTAVNRLEHVVGRAGAIDLVAVEAADRDSAAAAAAFEQALLERGWQPPPAGTGQAVAPSALAGLCL